MRKSIVCFIGVLAALGISAAHAQDDSLDGLELDVLEADETPVEAFDGVLTLPGQADPRAREGAAPGLERANEARERGAELGQSVAEQAREGRGDGRGRGEGAGGEGGGPPEDRPGPPEGTPGGP